MAQQVLYSETRVTTDVFRYFVNQGGQLNLRVEPSEKDIEIVFENGRYARCKFNFRGPYNRTHWHILRGIADKITELETQFKNSATT